MEPVKVGLVGLGQRGFWVAHLANTIPEMTLTAVADIRPENLASAAGLFPDAQRFETGREMAERADIEAMIVVTADRFHVGNAKEAFENGKHVLVEKPLALSFEDLNEIARLQKASGLVLGTFLELRFGALWERVKEIVASGEIGPVLAASLVDNVGRDDSTYFGRMRTRSRDRVSTLVLQKGVHTLDLLNWFLGRSPRRVFAAGGLMYYGGDKPLDKRCRDCDDRDTCPHFHQDGLRMDPPGVDIRHDDDYCVWSAGCDVEDASFVTIEYGGGLCAHYREIHFAPEYAAHFTLYGEKAQLDAEGNYTRGCSFIQITERVTQEIRREDPTGDVGHGDADPALLRDFAQAIREGRSPRCDLRAGFESAAIGAGTRRSIDTGQAVELPLLDDV